MSHCSELKLLNGLGVQVVVVVSLFGTNVAQIVASASDAYYLNDTNSLDKRQLGIVFGALMQLSVLLPTLRHFRFINIFGLVGTTYTAWYIVVAAAMHGIAPNAGQRTATSMRNFYNGFAVIMSAFGGHANAIEIMDSMFVPEGYTRVYGWSFLYIFSLTLPHSTAVQLAWPDQALHNGNVYGILPLTLAKQLSIYLMLVHQLIAFCLYSAPLYYMCEKALRVHTKPIYIRVLARLPVCKWSSQHAPRLNSSDSACSSAPDCQPAQQSLLPAQPHHSAITADLVSASADVAVASRTAFALHDTSVNLQPTNLSLAAASPAAAVSHSFVRCSLCCSVPVLRHHQCCRGLHYQPPGGVCLPSSSIQLATPHHSPAASMRTAATQVGGREAAATDPRTQPDHALRLSTY
eukprot:GHRQ01027672.1.p1 GENE.GHRQ01027672.1~~GHRQ01027672.1.p1  ORF type:complete len:406 (+),score=102.40 GHRQ01027672.1:318-1535(+)